jgi:hypothetical protein
MPKQLQTRQHSYIYSSRYTCGLVSTWKTPNPTDPLLKSRFIPERVATSLRDRKSMADSSRHGPWFYIAPSSKRHARSIYPCEEASGLSVLQINTLAHFCQTNDEPTMHDSCLQHSSVVASLVSTFKRTILWPMSVYRSGMLRAISLSRMYGQRPALGQPRTTAMAWYKGAAPSSHEERNVSNSRKARSAAITRSTSSSGAVTATQFNCLTRHHMRLQIAGRERGICTAGPPAVHM